MSTVATAEREETTAGRIDWSRTPEQQALIDAHIRQVQRQYIDMGADPELVALLLDEEILGTPDVQREMGYTKKTRVFQLYAETDRRAADDQMPHPTAFPFTDASPGRRGAREIRGIMFGRFLLWAMQTGRLDWDPINKELVEQTGINHGGAPRRA